MAHTMWLTCLGLMKMGAAASVLAAPTKAVIAYLPNWNDPAALLKSLDFAKVTHLNVAFENPVDDQGTLSFSTVDDLAIKLGHAHGVKVLLSIGGGGASEDKAMQARYFALQTVSKRSQFVARLSSFVQSHGFDGLDVDLEGAAIGKDYNSFIAELAEALKPKAKLLTAAVSEGNGGESISNTTLTLFDFVNVMAYDATGPWNPNVAGPHASLEFTRSCVAYWIHRGVPSSKIVVGIPFYGYGFGTAFRAGDYSYGELVKTYPGAESLDQVGNTIYYNGMPTVRAKTQYVVDHALGGVMIWELGGDATGSKSLLSVIDSTLHPKR